MTVERKFCTGCMRDRLKEGGAYTVSAKNRINRWKCADCLACKNVSSFSKKRIDDRARRE